MMRPVTVSRGGDSQTKETSAERDGAGSVGGIACAGVAVASLAIVLLWARGNEAGGLLLTLSIAAFALMFARASWRKSLSVRLVLLLSAGLLVVAVVGGPNGTDLWYYQMYGRVLVHYHESPYRHAPEEFNGDPVRARTDQFWIHVRAEYGPILVGGASVIAAVTGTNELAARLAWQGLAALAVWMALLLVARRTMDGAAVALIGLNPVVIYAVVNAGHADAFIGLAVLAGVLSAQSRRSVLAALAFTAAALIKWPAGVALVAFLLWDAFHAGIRKTLKAAAAAAATAVVAIACFGGPSVVRPALDARDRANGVTPWNLTRAHGFDMFRAVVPTLGPLSSVVPTLAVGVGLLIAACVFARRVRDNEPSLLIGSVIVAWQVTALYTSSWSVFWALPILALHRRALVTRLMVAWFCLLLLQQYWAVAALSVHGSRRAAYIHANAVLIAACVVGAIAIAVALVFVNDHDSDHRRAVASS
jgi:hypothetical protein